MGGDSLGDRMKRYEQVPAGTLSPYTPVIIRLDGKAFHTWTKGLNRPFCHELHSVMADTTAVLCKNIQNAVCGYTQSDEISILVYDKIRPTTEQWFGNKIQKMVSVAASIATASFNEHVRKYECFEGKPPALFDARAFNIPEHEIINAFIWRQQDATRNSVQMLAQSMFSHKELQGLSSNQLQHKMLTEKDVNWNDVKTIWKRGACVTLAEGENGRAKWKYDPEIPIFTEDRDYIQRAIDVKKEKK